MEQRQLTTFMTLDSTNWVHRDAYNGILQYTVNLTFCCEYYHPYRTR